MSNMRILRVLYHTLRSLWSGDRLEAEDREEIASHVERQTEFNIASGMTPSEARRSAILDVGQVQQLGEACRDARGLRWWDALRGDLRYGLRQIRRTPASPPPRSPRSRSASAPPAPFLPSSMPCCSGRCRSARPTVCTPVRGEQPGQYRADACDAPQFPGLAAAGQVVLGMAAHIGNGFTLTGSGEPVFTLGQVVTPNFLDVLGVKPMLGRGFLPNETEAGHHRVAILNHALWMQHYGGDSSIVGRTALVNGEPYAIVGVMGPSFNYPSDAYQLMTPFVTKGTVKGGPPMTRSARYLRVIGRLSDNTSEETAREELSAVGRRLAEAYPDANETVAPGMTGLAKDLTGGAESNLVIVLMAVGFVLLIACVNVAGLTIARGSARGRELAVRAAIGASRGRLVRQLATEGLLLFAIGGAVGLTLAAWGVNALAAELPASIPRAGEITVDWRFLTFGAAMTLAAGMIFSVLPAFSIARRGPSAGLAGSRGTVSAARSVQRTRGMLIAAQIAAAVVLVAGAALALRSFDHVRKADSGFETAQTMTFGFVMRDQRYPAASDLRTFSTSVYDTLAAVPGIEAVGLTTHLPLGDNNFENSFTVDGSPVEAGQDSPLGGVRGVAGHYRAAIGARTLEGRDLTPADTQSSQPVAVVTADFAKRYVKAASPIGVRLKMGGADSEDPWRTIVGVIADVRHSGLDQAPRPEVWMPYAQLPDDILVSWLRGLYAAARTVIEPTATMPEIRSAMRTLDSGLPLVNVRTLEELASESTAERRLETSLLAGFGVMALVLAAVGLFGVLAFFVSQHMQEFGVRLALGATPRGLLGVVIKRGLVLLAIGVAIGLPGAFAMGRGMSTLLYGVEPADPIALGGAVFMLFIVTLAACALPARRAMRTDPLIALRRD